jgi:hypothetical protein
MSGNMRPSAHSVPVTHQRPPLPPSAAHHPAPAPLGRHPSERPPSARLRSIASAGAEKSWRAWNADRTSPRHTGMSHTPSRAPMSARPESRSVERTASTALGMHLPMHDHLEQLATKARHGRSFAPRKRRLGRIRAAKPACLVAFGPNVVRPATTTSRRASAAPQAVTADGQTAEQPAGRPRTVRELGSLYNAYNNVYIFLNVPDAHTSDAHAVRPFESSAVCGGANHTHDAR